MDADGLRPLRRASERVVVTRVREGRAARAGDVLAGEEPLEIRVAAPGRPPRSLAVVMRTPGHDFELAAGFLLTEGVVDDADAVTRIAYCDEPAGEQRYNVVTVSVGVAVPEEAFARRSYASASCGICGKTSIDEVAVACAPIPSGPRVPAGVLHRLPDGLRARQRIFDRTGGVHAAGLFDVSGAVVAVREDVGRHNAMDKLVGRALLDGDVPLSWGIVAVSGRVSFEIVQKAARAGVPVLCAVSAPSSLAVTAAQRLGITVAGFVRDGGFNLYSHPERVEVGAGELSR